MTPDPRVHAPGWGCRSKSRTPLNSVFFYFLYSATQKEAGYYVLPSELWVSVRLSVICPSISASFPCTNFSIFWPIFFKLCLDIGIGEEWYGIASGLISFWNNSYGPWCMSKMLCASFPCSNFSTFLPIFFKLCIDIGIGEEWYGIASGIISFRNNRVMALDFCPKCILVNILRMNRQISIKFCICIA